MTNSLDQRRSFLRRVIAVVPTAAVLSTGAAVSQVACTEKSPAGTAAADPASAKYFPTYLNDAEWAFVNVAVAHLIPADDLGPGALEAGVPEFIDRQLETPWAHGKLWYTQGPFQPDAIPEMGYQHKMTPRDIFRHGIADCNQWCTQNRNGKTFAQLDKAGQEEILHMLEGKKMDLPNVPATLFFSYLLNTTRQGFLADPIYGGNKGMVGWKLIGFPGARADFMDWIDQPNKPYPFGPVSINGARA